VSEAFLILESFYISSGLHSDAAVKTLCVWQYHDHTTVVSQFLGKNNLHSVDDDK
jgi:hypothetical protein